MCWFHLLLFGCCSFRWFVMDVIKFCVCFFLFHFVFINSFICVPFEQLVWAAHRKRNRCCFMSSAQRMKGKTKTKWKERERGREKKMEIKLDSIKLEMIVYLIWARLYVCVYVLFSSDNNQSRSSKCTAVHHNCFQMLVNNRCCYMLIVFKSFAARSMTAFKTA